MNPERWQRVQRLFEEALAQPAEARRAFIVSACGGEVELKDELLSLLAAHEEGRKVEVPTPWLGALGDSGPAGAGPGAGPEVVDQLNAAFAGRYAIQRELGSG